MVDEFRALLSETDAVCGTYFKPRLLATYITGSIMDEEAWPYQSDLDYWVFLDSQLTDADQAWSVGARANLQARYPIVRGVHISVRCIEEFITDPFSVFILKYNCKRVSGIDLIAFVEGKCHIPLPGAAVAKGRLDFGRKCLQELLAGKRPSSLEELPKSQPFRLRKIAKGFVIVEGAYFLMSKGAFSDFRTASVLNGLTRFLPEFKEGLELTYRIIADPTTAIAIEEEYLSFVALLLEKLFSQIEQAGE